MQYLAVILLIAGVAASVVSTGAGERVTSGVENAICRVAAEDCKTAAAPQGTAPKPNNGQGSSTKNTWYRPYRKASPIKAARSPDRAITEHRRIDAERKWLLSQGYKVVIRKRGDSEVGSEFDMANKTVYIDSRQDDFFQFLAWDQALKFAGGITDLKRVNPGDFISDEEYREALRESSTEYWYQRARLNRIIESYLPDFYPSKGDSYTESEERYTVPDYQGDYDRGYENAVANAERSQVASRSLSEAEKQRIGERGGREAISKKVKTLDSENDRLWRDPQPTQSPQRSKRGWQCLWVWHCS